jgi:plasmid replication initiation protein
MTSIRQPTDRRRRRFSWINEWKETADAPGHARGIELVLPDWLYTGILNDALVLTIDRGYFDLTGGLERWPRVRKQRSSASSDVIQQCGGSS